MEVTEDGSPVEVYRRLPETGEADLVALVVAPGASILEAKRTGVRIRATMEYGLDGETWRQSFEAELLDEEGLATALAGPGLSFTGWLDRDRGWLEARPA